MTPNEWRDIASDATNWALAVNLAACALNVWVALRNFPPDWLGFILRRKRITLIDIEGGTRKTFAQCEDGIWVAYEHPQIRVGRYVLLEGGIAKQTYQTGPREGELIDGYVRWWRDA